MITWTDPAIVAALIVGGVTLVGLMGKAAWHLVHYGARIIAAVESTYHQVNNRPDDDDGEAPTLSQTLDTVAGQVDSMAGQLDEMEAQGTPASAAHLGHLQDQVDRQQDQIDRHGDQLESWQEWSQGVDRTLETILDHVTKETP